MLNLHAPTSDRWLSQVEGNLDLLLIDHAHCEKKAAGTALNLLFAYVENEPLCRAMTEIVNEELEHFHMVLDLLARRGVRFRRLPPSSYGRKLNDLVRNVHSHSRITMAAIRAASRMIQGLRIFMPAEDRRKPDAA